MKKRYLYLAALGLIVIPAAAQETYQSEKLIENDLNGTARYVGMGGAMEALGADISTISSNPAGIGLFRSSQVALSGGLVVQGSAKTSLNYDNTDISIKGHKNNASFDQIGFVWAHRTGNRSFLNFAFNYHKGQNFDQILSTAGSLIGQVNNNTIYASQNKLSALKYNNNATDSWQTNALDAAYIGNTSNPGMLSIVNGVADYLDGKYYLFGQYQHGYIGNYDFNISGNINDRVYLGVTFGIQDVHYHSNSFYTENLENSQYSNSFESLRITGTGFDAKFGAIFRPIADSPFRIGLYVNTPIFYDLSLSASSDVDMGFISNPDNTASRGNDADYDYKINTPWKFGVSLGHTIGNYLALGATYEYSDYSTLDNRYNDGGYYDNWYGDYYQTSVSDDAMNDNTKFVLKGVHTLKLGAEYKPIKDMAIRLGYNYISPKFNKNGFRDGSIASPGTAYATSTDYTNWGSTNRFTCGLGYTMDKFFFDMAYQYSSTNGDFYPFMSYTPKVATDYEGYNVANASKVSNKRNQVLLTLGYKF